MMAVYLVNSLMKSSKRLYKVSLIFLKFRLFKHKFNHLSQSWTHSKLVFMIKVL